MYHNLRSLGQWLKISIFALFLVGMLAACGTGNGNGSLPTATSTGTGFQVASVDMSVNPATIAGLTCGTNLTVTYTATFHVAANSPGGTVNFLYTVDNGRSTPSASLTFAPGETQKTYSFTWSGNLPADHTYPGLGGVVVTSPNQITSSTVKPAGSCTIQGTATTQGAAFQVTSIDMSVNPTSIQGNHCGTYLTVTYTATFHVTPNSPGGVVQFEYTVNNGRATSQSSLTFGPGETTKTFTFTWAGNLPADHVYPEGGGADSTSPNMVTSQLVAPTGQCS